MRSAIAPGDGDPRHGTTNGYTNLRCRCGACRGAHAALQLHMRVRRAARAGGDHPGGKPHSETTYFNYQCRCSRCRAAHTAAERLRRGRRSGQTGAA